MLLVILCQPGHGTRYIHYPPLARRATMWTTKGDITWPLTAVPS
jgi:hypothetical protein